MARVLILAASGLAREAPVSIRQNLRIGRDAIVGQGAVIPWDVQDGQTWVSRPPAPLDLDLPEGARP